MTTVYITEMVESRIQDIVFRHNVRTVCEKLQEIVMQLMHIYHIRNEE